MEVYDVKSSSQSIQFLYESFVPGLIKRISPIEKHSSANKFFSGAFYRICDFVRNWTGLLVNAIFLNLNWLIWVRFLHFPFLDLFLSVSTFPKALKLSIAIIRISHVRSFLRIRPYPDAFSLQAEIIILYHLYLKNFQYLLQFQVKICRLYMHSRLHVLVSTVLGPKNYQ